MTSKIPELHPLNQTLPSEILIKIAEACVEPYSIELKPTTNNNTTSTYPLFTIYRTTPVIKLAFTSRNFYTGIKNGLRTKFDGHLSLPPTQFREATIFLTATKRLTWIMQQTTQLALFPDTARTPPIPSSPDELYPFRNLKSIATGMVIRCTHLHALFREYGEDAFGKILSWSPDTDNTMSAPPMGISRGLPLLFLQWVVAPDYVADAETYAYRHAHADAEANIETAPFEYINVDLRITLGKCRILKYYTTECLEWRTRSNFDNGDGGLESFVWEVPAVPVA